MCSRASLLAGLLLLPGIAHAYIDPGTTGLVVGGIAGALAWGLVALAFLRRTIAAGLRLGARGAARHPALAALVIASLGIAAGTGRAWLTRKEEPVTSIEEVVGSTFKRVLLIGIDGVDPDDVRALIHQGLLPNFHALAKAGGFRDMQIPNPAQSPVVWASLATGQNPGRHGIFDFIGRAPASYLPRLAVLEPEGSGYRYPLRARAFWDVTSEHQVPTVVLRWPMTFPPERIQGRVLAGLGVPDVRGGLGRYSYFTDRAIADDEDGKDLVQRVEVRDGVVDATLTGPRARGLTGVKDLTLPLQLRLGSDGRSAVLTVGAQHHALEVGRFSDWVELTFTSGLFGKYRGLARFYLESAAEPFALYATAIELHPEAPLQVFTTPPAYAQEMRAAIGLYHTLGMPEDTKAYGNGHLPEQAFFEMCRAVEAERRAMLLHELGRFERGVLAVVFDTSDRIQHMTPRTDDVASSALGRYLIAFDRFLGEVIAAAPPATPLLVFSDHGFADFDRSVDLNRWLVEAGYLVLDQEAYARRDRDDSGELFKYVRWDQSRAYAVGFSGLYVNVQGREGQGVVPAEQRAALVQEIAGKLRGLTDPTRGAPVVRQVYPRDELYRGAQQAQAPDLVVGYEDGYRGSWQSAVGGLTEQVVTANDKRWQRDHIVDPALVPASLLANFELTERAPHAYDLAPTVLSLLGLPIPEEMEGRPLNASAPELVQAGAHKRTEL